MNLKSQFSQTMQIMLCTVYYYNGLQKGLLMHWFRPHSLSLSFENANKYHPKKIPTTQIGCKEWSMKIHTGCIPVRFCLLSSLRQPAERGRDPRRAARIWDEPAASDGPLCLPPLAGQPGIWQQRRWPTWPEAAQSVRHLALGKGQVCADVCLILHIYCQLKWLKLFSLAV